MPSPAIDGYVQPAFEPVYETFKNLWEDIEVGASLAVYRSGELVIDLIRGQGSAVNNFRNYCNDFPHSYKHVGYLAMRSLGLNHERTKTAVAQLKTIKINRITAPKDTLTVNIDYSAFSLDQLLTSQRFQ